MAKTRGLSKWDISLQGNNHLLAIGIDEYDHCANLSNAVSDAQSFVRLMLDKYQFNENNVHQLYDDQATKVGITTALRKLVDKIDEGKDNVIVYYSGHGYYDEMLEEGYWVPVEAQYKAEVDYLSYSYIIKIINALQTRHTLFIVDSCYSGAVMVRAKDINAERFEKNPSRWMLASGRNEVVPDGVAGENSPFAEQLLDTLERYSDEGMRVSDLVTKVTTAVVYNSKQTPIGRPIYGVGDKGGEFVFHPRHSPVDDWNDVMEANTIDGYEGFISSNPDSDHLENAHWGIACLKESALAYDDFLERFPNGEHSNEALKKMHEIEEEEVWQNARRIDSLSSYRKYLRKYPRGEFSEQASSRRAELKEIERQEQDWKRVLQDLDRKSIEGYIKKHPDAYNIHDAQWELERIIEAEKKALDEDKLKKESEKAEKEKALSDKVAKEKIEAKQKADAEARVKKEAEEAKAKAEQNAKDKSESERKAKEDARLKKEKGAKAKAKSEQLAKARQAKASKAKEEARIKKEADEKAMAKALTELNSGSEVDSDDAEGLEALQVQELKKKEDQKALIGPEADKAIVKDEAASMHMDSTNVWILQLRHHGMYAGFIGLICALFVSGTVENDIIDRDFGISFFILMTLPYVLIIHYGIRSSAIRSGESHLKFKNGLLPGLFISLMGGLSFGVFADLLSVPDGFGSGLLSGMLVGVPATIVSSIILSYSSQKKPIAEIKLASRNVFTLWRYAIAAGAFGILEGFIITGPEFQLMSDGADVALAVIVGLLISITVFLGIKTYRNNNAEGGFPIKKALAPGFFIVGWSILASQLWFLFANVYYADYAGIGFLSLSALGIVAVFVSALILRRKEDLNKNDAIQGPVAKSDENVGSSTATEEENLGTGEVVEVPKEHKSMLRKQVTWWVPVFPPEGHELSDWIATLRKQYLKVRKIRIALYGVLALLLIYFAFIPIIDNYPIFDPIPYFLVGILGMFIACLERETIFPVLLMFISFFLMINQVIIWDPSYLDFRLYAFLVPFPALIVSVVKSARHRRIKANSSNSIELLDKSTAVILGHKPIFYTNYWIYVLTASCLLIVGMTMPDLRVAFTFYVPVTFILVCAVTSYLVVRRQIKLTGYETTKSMGMHLGLFVSLVLIITILAPLVIMLYAAPDSQFFYYLYDYYRTLPYGFPAIILTGILTGFVTLSFRKRKA